jgi:predicted nucleotidyltransferase
MSKTPYPNTTFRKLINSFFKEHKSELLDILLFGSCLKGKENPEDIDVLLIYKEKENIDTNYKLKKILKEYPVEITSKTYANIFDSSFIARESFLEAESLITGRSLAKSTGYDMLTLFRYDLRTLSPSDRTRFYYSLNGRNSPGLLTRLKGVRFSDKIIAIPLSSIEPARQFFDSWKLPYLEVPAAIPTRIVESEAFPDKA